MNTPGSLHQSGKLNVLLFGGPQMNISTMSQTNPNVIIACDVSKDTINLVVKFGRHCIEREVRNHSTQLEKHFVQLRDFLLQYGFKRVWVVAEPTGIYHRPLFRTAKRLGSTPGLSVVSLLLKYG